MQKTSFTPPGLRCNGRTPNNFLRDRSLAAANLRDLSSKWGDKSKKTRLLGHPLRALSDLPWWPVENFRGTRPAAPQISWV